MAGYIRPVVSMLFLFLFTAVSNLIAGSPGEVCNMMIKPFEFESCEGERINRDFIENSGIMFLIYGNPNSLESKRPALDKILDLIKSKNYENSLMYIVDFRGYPGLMSHFIKSNLSENEKQLGIKIYADWNGNMANNQNFKKDKVYFLILKNPKEISNAFQIDNSETIENSISNHIN